MRIGLMVVLMGQNASETKQIALVAGAILLFL